MAAVDAEHELKLAEAAEILNRVLTEDQFEEWARRVGLLNPAR